MLKALCLVSLLSSIMFAQGNNSVAYVATTGNVVLAAAATTASLQQPTANGLPVNFPASPGVGAAIYCSAACVATLGINTTPTSPSTGTVNPVLPNSPKAVVNLITAAATTGGTSLVAYNIAAGQTFTIDLSAMRLGGASSTITISIASMTGTVNVTYFPLEIH